jgi:peptidylprolyl isomerase/FKBP-type peptidyl-prolyl cis-trans isomerase FklB
MKKYGLYLILLFVTTGFVASCDDDDDNHKERWMVENQRALNEIRTSPDYKEIKSPGNEASIYYKVIEKGDGTEPIYYTSRVKCYYKGWFVADYPEVKIKKGLVFDQKLWDDGTPYSFTVGTDVIKGWAAALQHMVKGDKWEIWIPYQLAYGEGDSQTIPGFSTLAFEIEVVDVTGIDDQK